MKLFGGFSGKHFHAKGANAPEQEQKKHTVTDDTILYGAVEPKETPRVLEPEAEDPEPVAAEPEQKPEPAAEEAEAVSEEHTRTPEEEAEIEEMIRRYQKKKWTRRGIILGVLVLIAAAILILWKSTVKPPDIVKPTPTAAVRTPEPTAQPGGATATPSGNEVENTPEPTEEPIPERQRRENVYSILILGHDQGNGNTDTIMVVQYDADAKDINVLSVPRDTCANVDSNESLNELKKISGVYARAGVEGMMDAMGDIMGAPLDGYVMVGLNGFIHLVETIGGVDFDVPYYMNYDDPTQDLHIHYNPGMQHLNGYDAVKVVRWRQNNDGTNYGDIARIQVQQAFLTTVAKKCLSLSNLASNLAEYVKIFETYVKTDLTNGNLIWFAQEFLNLGMENIHFHTIPSNATDNIKGWAYGTILVDEWLEMLNAYFNVYDQPITVKDVDIISRDASGNLYATSGEIRGGMESFLDYHVYLKRLDAWLKQQGQSSGGNEAGSGGSSGSEAPPAEQEPESGSSEGAGETAPTAGAEPENTSGGEGETAPTAAPEPEPETGGSGAGSEGEE